MPGDSTDLRTFLIMHFYLSCVKIEGDGAAGMWPLGELTDDVTWRTIVRQTHSLSFMFKIDTLASFSHSLNN